MLPHSEQGGRVPLCIRGKRAGKYGAAAGAVIIAAEGHETRYIGDALALVACRHKESLDEVLSLIEVDYTELTPLTNPRDALKEDAPKIHEGGNLLTKEVLKRGDADAAIAASAHVVKTTYHVPFTDHAFMEPGSHRSV